jgi:hypothetical protein
MSMGSGEDREPSRLRAVKDDGATPGPAIEPWMLEVRRLCAALSPPAEGRMATDVTLAHLPVQPPGKPVRLVWRAACHLGSAETDAASSSMLALLHKLNGKLDERIKAQADDLQKLREARHRSLRVVEGE